jgi:hypothetical protein
MDSGTLHLGSYFLQQCTLQGLGEALAPESSTLRKIISELRELDHLEENPIFMLLV